MTKGVGERKNKAAVIEWPTFDRNNIGHCLNQTELYSRKDAKTLAYFAFMEFCILLSLNVSPTRFLTSEPAALNVRKLDS